MDVNEDESLAAEVSSDDSADEEEDTAEIKVLKVSSSLVSTRGHLIRI